ncbi:MAG: hypothetical protein ACI9ON_003409 [Limisphaerales bacterium]|jgi:hypothetical protein
MSSLKTIQSIANCYKANNLCLSVLPETPELTDQSLRDIQLQATDIALKLTVFDEYKDTPLFQSLYQQLSNTIPKIRDIIGAEVTAIDYHHIEFNTDIAKALREYKL